LVANDWWKTFSLFLWFYYTTATALVLVYFYGICRLAERKFMGRTYAGFLVVFFVLMGASTLIFAVSESIIAVNLWYAVWPGIAGLVLFFIVYRAYRVMMG
jgi:hypothetical protein